jgi:hypothetical protein
VPKSKAKVERFDRIDRSALKMKEASKRTRTGALNTPNRVRAHKR